jgi:hypothetical protein
MHSTDIYTKVVLTIIMICLAVLCVEDSHWNRLQTVQAQSGHVLIGGYTFEEDGKTQSFRLGTDSGDRSGIPVVVRNNSWPPKPKP